MPALEDLITTGDVADGTHSHSGADITSGTVADARIAATIARDSEITTDIATHAAIGAAHAAAASQPEAEAGTEAALRSWSPLRVAQAIAALGSGSGVPQGTAFPGGPATNDHFCRTDINNMEFFFDGTRWRSVEVFNWIGNQEVVGSQSASTTFTRGGFWQPTYDVFLLELRGAVFVLTTNNGTNNWTVALKKASDNSTIGSFSTSAGAADTRLNVLVSINAVSTEQVVYLALTKVLAPGNIFVWTHLTYQIIAT